MEEYSFASSATLKRSAIGDDLLMVPVVTRDLHTLPEQGGGNARSVREGG